MYEQEDEKHGDGRHEGGQNLGDDLFVHGGEAAVFYDDSFRKPVLELLFYVFLQPLHRGRLTAPAFHIRIDADRVPACQTREFGEFPVGFESGQLPQGNADSRHGGGHHKIAQRGVVGIPGKVLGVEHHRYLALTLPERGYCLAVEPSGER